MIKFELWTDHYVALNPRHIVSVGSNDRAEGSIIRMANGDQWAPRDMPMAVVSAIVQWLEDNER